MAKSLKTSFSKAWAEFVKVKQVVRVIAIPLVAENSRARPFMTLKCYSEGMRGLIASRTSYTPWFISIHLSLSQKFGGSWRSTGNTKEYKEKLLGNKNERD